LVKHRSQTAAGTTAAKAIARHNREVAGQLFSARFYVADFYYNALHLVYNLLHV
jgi:hypothetical protein